MAPTDAIDAFNLWTTDDGGWLDVVFDEPALRAGGWVLGSSGSVQFFDTAGSLLGTVAAPGPENNDWWPGSFAGWQTDALPIRRVRFNDVGNTGWTIGVDSVTWEPVPEPAAPLLFTAVLLLASRRRGVTAS